MPSPDTDISGKLIAEFTPRTAPPAMFATPLVGEEASLWTLAVSSFLAATLLPGGSEAVLALTLRMHPEQWLTALVIATVGNTLGGLLTYAMARWLPPTQLPARLDWVRRYGPAALLLAWVPLVGDALCVAAGWLRADWRACALTMAIGKGARYLAVAWLALP